MAARLFSFITRNWRDKPLVSHEVIVNLIAATKTRSGLHVISRLDTKVSQRAQGLSPPPPVADHGAPVAGRTLPRQPIPVMVGGAPRSRRRPRHAAPMARLPS